MNVYLITFSLARMDVTALHEIIKNSEYIKGWWHYLPNTYLVKSDLRAKGLFTEINDKLPDQQFIVIQVKKNYHGRLPKGSWDWIKKNLTE